MTGPDGNTVLYRFVDNAGGEFALGFNFVADTGIVKSCWYMNRSYRKVYVNFDTLVDAYRVRKHVDKPEVRVLATPCNPNLAHAAARVVLNHEVVKTSACYLRGHADWVRPHLISRMAVKAKLSFRDFNAYLAKNPQTLILDL